MGFMLWSLTLISVCLPVCLSVLWCIGCVYVDVKVVHVCITLSLWRTLCVCVGAYLCVCFGAYVFVLWSPCVCMCTCL